jgi:hypothetical protein
MSPDDSGVIDILRAARLAVDFRAGFGRVAFLQDLKTQSAISACGMTEESMVTSAEHVHGPWRYERFDGAGHRILLKQPELLA